MVRALRNRARALANRAPENVPSPTPRLPSRLPRAPGLSSLRGEPPGSATTHRDDAPSQVGLPDDELHRRIGTHRGVYGRYRDVVPNERALYHLVPARWFNAQLPIGAGRDGYVTEDFHVLGGIETFRDLDKLLAHANEQLAEQRGYFYVLQLDFDDPEASARARDAKRPTEGKKNAASVSASASAAEDSDSDASADAFVMVQNDARSNACAIPEPNRDTGVVFVRAAVDVDCIQRVYVASRAEEASRAGAFTNVTPP